MPPSLVASLRPRWAPVMIPARARSQTFTARNVLLVTGGLPSAAVTVTAAGRGPSAVMPNVIATA